MKRVQRIIKTVEPQDSAKRYTELGVEIIAGTAKIVSPWEVDVVHNDGRSERLIRGNIVIAAGAHPCVHLIPGIGDMAYYTSDTI